MYIRIKYKMNVIEIHINVISNCEYKHCPELQI